MDPNVAQESHRVSRYLIVRIVSRGGDVGIFFTLLWLWGTEWLIPAFSVSAAFNYLTDFIGQKCWAFKSPDRRPMELLREFGLYIVVRGGNIAAAAGLFGLLYGLLGFRWWTAMTVVVIVFWTLVFGLYRWLFTGSVRDLLQLVRDLVHKVFAKARSS